VADSKLCSRENMDHIDRAGGRFVTVMPRSRLEDAQFRQAIQTRTPEWTLVWERPNPRYADGPRDCWYVHRASLPSMEGWSIVWVWSTVLTLRQHARRTRNLAAAEEQLQQLRQRLASAKTRLRGAAEIDLAVKLILDKFHVARYLKVRRVVCEEHVFKQTRRGRPGPNTAYRKLTKRRFDVQWSTDDDAIAYDRNSDGMYPLMTNDRQLSAAQVLEAHKGQPMIEKRFEQIKTVHEIAPVFLKDEGRIDWTRPAREVHNRVRAMDPWPGAYFFWERPGQQPLRLTLTGAGRVGRELPPGTAPGSFLGLVNGRLAIACADRAYLVAGLKPEGKKAMDAPAFACGYLGRDLPEACPGGVLAGT